MHRYNKGVYMKSSMALILLISLSSCSFLLSPPAIAVEEKIAEEVVEEVFEEIQHPVSEK
jgi:hypothetical protein